MKLVDQTVSIETSIKNQKGDPVKVFAFYVEHIPEVDLPLPCPPPRGLRLDVG